MSILLYAAGALFVAIGAGLIGFGIPINEFSFGNTLIIAGMVAMVGGLIVLALGVVVRELRHLADSYSHAGVRAPRASDGDSQPMPPRAPPPPVSHVPFPPKAPNALRPVEVAAREPAVSFAPEPRDEPAPVREELPPPFPTRRPMTTPVAAAGPRAPEGMFGAPTLPNPAELPEVDRSDRFRATEADVEEAAELAEAGEWDETDKVDEAAKSQEAAKPDEVPEAPDPASPVFAPSRRSTAVSGADDKPERSYFDAMWPAEPETPRRAPELKPSATDLSEPVPSPAEPEPERDEESSEEPRTVPILKSGVVDGMGYTLYVDGSIEAELPQGTLRFASINELRAHLEKTS